MASLRVTQPMFVNRVLRNINQQQRRILDLQEQLATGLRVNRPSDSPIDARRGVSTRSLIAEQQQFIDNITAVRPFLSEASATILTAVDIVQRTQEVTLQAANSVNDADNLFALSQEVNQLLESLFVQANHQTSQRYIFAGTQTGEPAFSATRNAEGEITAVTYEGNSETIEVTIGSGIRAPINRPGSDVFQGGADLFQTLIDIRDNLRSGDLNAVQTVQLVEIEAGRDQLLRSVARIGAIENRLDSVSLDTEEFVVRLQAVLSETIEADFANVTLNLNSQFSAFQAALNAGARALQPSLLDFVR